MVTVTMETINTQKTFTVGYTEDLQLGLKIVLAYKDAIIVFGI